MGIDQTTPSAPGGEVSSATDNYSSYNPEPSYTDTSMFRDFMSTVGRAVGTLLGGKEIGGVSLDNIPAFGEDLLAAQIQAQIEMQQITMISNVERSKHESKMAAIRNMRLS